MAELKIQFKKKTEKRVCWEGNLYKNQQVSNI